MKKHFRHLTLACLSMPLFCLGLEQTQLPPTTQVLAPANNTATAVTHPNTNQPNTATQSSLNANPSQGFADGSTHAKTLTAIPTASGNSTPVPTTVKPKANNSSPAVDSSNKSAQPSSVPSKPVMAVSPVMSPNEYLYTITAKSGKIKTIGTGSSKKYQLILTNTAVDVVYLNETANEASTLKLSLWLTHWKNSKTIAQKSPQAFILMARTKSFYVDAVKLSSPSYNSAANMLTFNVEPVGKLEFSAVNFLNPVYVVFSGPEDLK